MITKVIKLKSWIDGKSKEQRYKAFTTYKLFGIIPIWYVITIYPNTSQPTAAY